MFKAGQVVEVVNSGRAYTTYHTLAHAMRLAKWQNGGSPKNGNLYTVLGSSPHLMDSSVTIVAITDGEQDYLINEIGVQVANIRERVAQLYVEVDEVRSSIQELQDKESALIATIRKLEGM